MPWNPTPQEEASLRNQIKQKWGNTFPPKSIDTAVDCLKEASGKKAGRSGAGRHNNVQRP
jgi:hypothetical protein